MVHHYDNVLRKDWHALYCIFVLLTARVTDCHEGDNARFP